MIRPRQLWTIAPAPGGGAFGAPYYSIRIAETSRALAVSGDDIVTVPAFTGAPEQVWRIDQLRDGSYRIAPRGTGATSVPRALVAISAAHVRFDPASPTGRWTFQRP